MHRRQGLYRQFLVSTVFKFTSRVNRTLTSLTSGMGRILGLSFINPFDPKKKETFNPEFATIAYYTAW